MLPKIQWKLLESIWQTSMSLKQRDKLDRQKIELKLNLFIKKVPSSTFQQLVLAATENPFRLINREW